jgi:NAD-dependent SIR2 family protein deacetylase
MFPRAIIDGIRDGRFRNIAVLTGAGISVASGIPDFRSPGGMYDTLRPELLTATPAQRRMMSADRTAVVDIDLFKDNQFPYLEVRRPFILGTAEKKWKPTIAHFFFRLLQDKGILRRIYTQNIDGLQFDCGIPDEKIVAVHGTISEAACEKCGNICPKDRFITAVRENIINIYDPNDPEAPRSSTNICCLSCGAPQVKPRTVLFGTSLPRNFFSCAGEDFPDNVDLLIVAGTSLVVMPAGGLVGAVSYSTPRVVVNLEQVGTELGLEYNESDRQRDYFVEGKTDDVFLNLTKELGWISDLMVFGGEMAPQSQIKLSEVTQCCIAGSDS